MDLESALQVATKDPLVHGIMIYYPCFGAAPSFYGGNMDDYLRDSVPIEKDIEGLCHTYRHNLYHNIRFIDSEVRRHT
jgi:methylenetetrahydrofolate dehydrogenase (NAD+)